MFLYMRIKIFPTGKYPLRGYVPSTSRAAKEDNVVEKILVCRDPNKSQGDGTLTEVQTGLKLEIVM